MPTAQKPSPLGQELKNVRGIKQIAKIKAAEFDIISVKNEKSGTMEGYRNREDISTLPPNTLVSGSHDVLTNVFGRVYSRAGYTLDGVASVNLGSELLTNGTFTGNANGWTLQSGWAYNNNNVIFTG